MRKFSEEHRRKISEALKGNKNGQGKVCSEEKKQKISKKLKGRIITQEAIEKGRKTREKNGTLHFYDPKAKIKEYETKRKNKSFNTSKPEQEILKILKNTFGEVKYQYTTEKYPFMCDFYIPSKDLYIEFQGHWTHGYRPFTQTEKDLMQLKKWKEKASISKFYKIGIKVWTITDPLKRQIAKENNLNWIEFFTLKEFLNWNKNNEIR